MSSINSPENLETYSLLWLDNYANSSSDNRRAQQQLQKLIPHLLTFEDDYQCFQYLTNLSINHGQNCIPKPTMSLHVSMN